MSEQEDLSKGLDAITIALRDISLRVKALPPVAVEEKKNVCPACGAEHQSNTTKVMHVAAKHPDWIVIRAPGKQMADEAIKELEMPVRVSPLPKGLLGGVPVEKLEKKSWLDRDWSKIAIGVVVMVVVLLVAAALFL